MTITIAKGFSTDIYLFRRVFGIYAGHNRLRHMVELTISNHA